MRGQMWLRQLTGGFPTAAALGEPGVYPEDEKNATRQIWHPSSCEEILEAGLTPE